MTCDIGLVGLAVMGQNLVLNMAEHGFHVAVFNRTVSKVDDFLQKEPGKNIVGTHSLEQFFSLLKRPRKAIFMVKAGEPVDELIQASLPYLDAGDIIIDGGNSNFVDTNRRCQKLRDHGIIFLGVGISGGEEGARHGPSLMPGGNSDGWQYCKDILQAIAAKVDHETCCDWVGDDGAGHFVKMVHNGIEYGDMGLIAESYDILHHGLGYSVDEISAIFSQWNNGKLKSYLIEITAKILQKKDIDGEPLIDKILDCAEQKGTGKWAVMNALELKVPLTIISEAVFSRYLSAKREERMEVSLVVSRTQQPKIQKSKEQLSTIENALYVAKILSYTQGFMLMSEAAKAYSWHLNLGNIAMLWRGGCIIRSAFLEKIKNAFTNHPEISSLICSPYFATELKENEQSLRDAVTLAASASIPTPCLSAALAFFDSYRSPKLPANLIQAQRDFFGAHMYERIDRARGQLFHTQWES